MKTIYRVLFVLGSMGLMGSFAQSNGLAELPELDCNPIVVLHHTYKNDNLRTSLYQAAKVLGIPICIELSGEDRALLERPVSADRANIITGKEVFQICREAGFRFSKYPNAILLSSSALQGSRDTPLDKTAQAFSFSGEHEEFPRALAEQFGILLDWNDSPHKLGSYDVQVYEAIALRDLLMKVAGRYGIMWTAVVNGKTPADDTNQTCRRMSLGFWAVDLSGRPENLGHVQVEHLIRAMNGRDQSSKRLAINKLLWLNNPAAIEPLSEIAASSTHETFAHHIIRALAKFFDEEPQVKDIIAEIGRSGDVNALRTALEFFQANNLEVPNDLIQAGLSSADIEKLYITLDFLVKHGNAKHVGLVQPLLEHKNADIRKLAKDETEMTHAYGSAPQTGWRLHRLANDAPVVLIGRVEQLFGFEHESMFRLFRVTVEESIKGEGLDSTVYLVEPPSADGLDAPAALLPSRYLLFLSPSYNQTSIMDLRGLVGANVELRTFSVYAKWQGAVDLGPKRRERANVQIEAEYGSEVLLKIVEVVKASCDFLNASSTKKEALSEKFYQAGGLYRQFIEDYLAAKKTTPQGGESKSTP